MWMATIMREDCEVHGNGEKLQIHLWVLTIDTRRCAWLDVETLLGIPRNFILEKLRDLASQDGRTSGALPRTRAAA